MPPSGFDTFRIAISAAFVLVLVLLMVVGWVRLRRSRAVLVVQAHRQDRGPRPSRIWGWLFLIYACQFAIWAQDHSVFWIAVGAAIVVGLAGLFIAPHLFVVSRQGFGYLPQPQVLWSQVVAYRRVAAGESVEVELNEYHIAYSSKRVRLPVDERGWNVLERALKEHDLPELQRGEPAHG